MTKSKWPYRAKFIKDQKRRLLDERSRTLSNIEADEADFLSWQADDTSGMNQHPADDATALAEQELDVSLLSNARYILSEIDDALLRIEDGTYGWDDEGQCWIREERLQALPWARREIKTQSRYEARMGIRPTGYTHDTDITSL